VFGVSDGLIAPFATHAAGTAPDGRVLSTPFCTVDYAIRLRRA